MKTGIELIAEERQEQIEKHGFTAMHDEEYEDEELRIAAVALLTPNGEQGLDYLFPALWNKGNVRKMCSKSYKQRLIIAGALIAAEYDRVQAIECEANPLTNTEK